MNPNVAVRTLLLTDEEVLRISDAAPGDTVASWCWGVLLDPEGLWV